MSLGQKTGREGVKEGWSLRVQTLKDIGCDLGEVGSPWGLLNSLLEQGRSGCSALQGDKTEICRAIERLS